MSVRVIAGLGNPGPAYVSTRHNIGFQKIDSLAEYVGGIWRIARRLESIALKTSIADRTILLAKPQTFMNHSGRALAALCRYYNIASSELVVVYDDIALPLGDIKLKTSGGSGGHKGVESLIAYFGCDFIRFKIGIGPKPAFFTDLKDFVLGRFSDDEIKVLAARHQNFIKCIYLLIDKGPLIAMNFINQRTRNR